MSAKSRKINNYTPRQNFFRSNDEEMLVSLRTNRKNSPDYKSEYMNGFEDEAVAFSNARSSNYVFSTFDNRLNILVNLISLASISSKLVMLKLEIGKKLNSDDFEVVECLLRQANGEIGVILEELSSKAEVELERMIDNNPPNLPEEYDESDEDNDSPLLKAKTQRRAGPSPAQRAILDQRYQEAQQRKRVYKKMLEENPKGQKSDKYTFIWVSIADKTSRPECITRNGKEFEVDGPEWEELGWYNCRCYPATPYGLSRKEKVDKALGYLYGNAGEIEKENKEKFPQQVADGKKKPTDLPDFGRHECAQHVRIGLNKAGYDVKVPSHGRLGPAYAKEYGPSLENAGFKEVTSFNQNAHIPGTNYPIDYVPKRGDVVVIQPNSQQPKPYGHMAMYDGNKWVSDFMQTDIWGGKPMRDEKPSYKIYRAMF